MATNLRTYAALWTSKLIRRAMTLIGRNATFFPGDIAYTMSSDVMRVMDKPKNLFAITGTNGKTTSANFLGDVLQDRGIKYMHNSYGSNTVEGVISSFVQFSSFFGRMPYDYGVIEVDERSSLRVYEHMTPTYLLVTNLFRDSYKRNAHVDYIFDIMDSAIPDETVLITNADDMIASRLKPHNRHVTYGIEPLEGEEQVLDSNVVDIENCPICDHPLRKDFVRYNHLGRFTCLHCGHTNMPRDYAITAVDREKEECTLVHKNQSWVFPLVSRNIVDLYNLVSTVALLHDSGFKMEDLQETYKKISVIESRFYEETCGEIEVIMLMAKAINPIASSRSFDYIRKQSGQIALIFGNTDFRDRGRNQENMAWLYDIDFHFLKQENIVQFITLGPRYKDIEARLLLEGIDPERVHAFEGFSPDIAKEVDYEHVDKIFILNDNDNVDEMMAIRNEVARLAREVRK